MQPRPVPGSRPRPATKQRQTTADDGLVFGVAPEGVRGRISWEGCQGRGHGLDRSEDEEKGPVRPRGRLVNVDQGFSAGSQTQGTARQPGQVTPYFFMTAASRSTPRMFARVT